MTLTVDQMMTLIEKEITYINKNKLKQDASLYLDAFDQELINALAAYYSTQKMTDVKHGEYSLFHIMALRKCGYVTAALMLQDYIDDPVNGRWAILRRR